MRLQQAMGNVTEVMPILYIQSMYFTSKVEELNVFIPWRTSTIKTLLQSIQSSHKESCCMLKKSFQDSNGHDRLWQTEVQYVKKALLLTQKLQHCYKLKHNIKTSHWRVWLLPVQYFICEVNSVTCESRTWKPGPSTSLSFDSAPERGAKSQTAFHSDLTCSNNIYWPR